MAVTSTPAPTTTPEGTTPNGTTTSSPGTTPAPTTATDVTTAPATTPAPTTTPALTTAPATTPAPTADVLKISKSDMDDAFVEQTFEGGGRQILLEIDGTRTWYEYNDYQYDEDGNQIFELTEIDSTSAVTTPAPTTTAPVTTPAPVDEMGASTETIRMESDVDADWVRTVNRDGKRFFLLRDEDGTYRWYEHLDAAALDELPDNRDRSTTQLALREASSEFDEIPENAAETAAQQAIKDAFPESSLAPRGREVEYTGKTETIDGQTVRTLEDPVVTSIGTGEAHERRTWKIVGYDDEGNAYGSLVLGSGYEYPVQRLDSMNVYSAGKLVERNIVRIRDDGQPILDTSRAEAQQQIKKAAEAAEARQRRRGRQREARAAEYGIDTEGKTAAEIDAEYRAALEADLSERREAREEGEAAEAAALEQQRLYEKQLAEYETWALGYIGATEAARINAIEDPDQRAAALETAIKGQDIREAHQRGQESWNQRLAEKRYADDLAKYQTWAMDHIASADAKRIADIEDPEEKQAALVDAVAARDRTLAASAERLAAATAQQERDGFEDGENIDLGDSVETAEAKIAYERWQRENARLEQEYRDAGVADSDDPAAELHRKNIQDAHAAWVRARNREQAAIEQQQKAGFDEGEYTGIDQRDATPAEVRLAQAQSQQERTGFDEGEYTGLDQRAATADEVAIAGLQRAGHLTGDEDFETIVEGMGETGLSLIESSAGREEEKRAVIAAEGAARERGLQAGARAG